MSETKFTPGPWVTGKRTNGYRKIDTCGLQHDDRHYGLAKVVVEIDGEPYKRGEANAALIAASPDMYPALERCIDTLDTARERLQLTGYTSAASDCADAILVCRAALAKARGET